MKQIERKRQSRDGGEGTEGRNIGGETEGKRNCRGEQTKGKTKRRDKEEGGGVEGGEQGEREGERGRGEGEGRKRGPDEKGRERARERWSERGRKRKRGKGEQAAVVFTSVEGQWQKILSEFFA
jgi:hypothetical protein